MWQARFHDRTEAGKLLAEKLKSYEDVPNGIVLGLPRGGVPVAYEISTALNLPLDVLVVRKLGVPEQPELAMGAIASGGGTYINQYVVDVSGISRDVIEQVKVREQRELERREHAFRGMRPPLDVRHRTVILVDDGIATGSTMLAGIQALKTQEPKCIVVAVPVAPRDTAARVQRAVDHFVCLETPVDFFAVGEAYEEFPQLTDDAVSILLDSRSTAPGLTV